MLAVVKGQFLWMCEYVREDREERDGEIEKGRARANESERKKVNDEEKKEEEEEKGERMRK